MTKNAPVSNQTMKALTTIAASLFAASGFVMAFALCLGYQWLSHHAPDWMYSVDQYGDKGMGGGVTFAFIFAVVGCVVFGLMLSGMFDSGDSEKTHDD